MNDVDTSRDPFGNPNTPPADQAPDSTPEKPKHRPRTEAQKALRRERQQAAAPGEPRFPLKPGQKRDKNGRPYQAKRGPYNYKKEPAATIAPAEIPPAAPSTETPPAPPPPKGEAESRRSWEMRSMTEVRIFRGVLVSPPAERIPMWTRVPAANEAIRRQPGFSTGWFGSAVRIIPTATRITPHLDLLVPILLGLRAEWPTALTPWAVDKLNELPDPCVLWRVTSTVNRVGLCWCLDRDNALSYATCPAIRQRSPLMIEALVDKANIVHLAESVRGWDVLAIVQPSDVVSESPLHQTK